jgi:mono/diheme cytochrome c family protein
MRLLLIALVATLAGGCAPKAPVVERTGLDAERGRLLYETACIACHTAQAHWREQRLVRDWSGLVRQVTRWQGVAGQSWSGAEIGDVSAYLNRRFYQLPCDQPGCAGPPG